MWCEFPTSDHGPVEKFADQVRWRFPDARFVFNWSSSFKWFNEPAPITFTERAELGYKFVFITLGAQHAMGHGLSTLLRSSADTEERGYIELQKQEREPGADFPTKSHHFFSGVPYHQLIGKHYDAARLGSEFAEKLSSECVGMSATRDSDAPASQRQGTRDGLLAT